MAGNHNDRRKAKNGRGSPAEREGAKKNGRGESRKANGGNAALAGALIAIGGAEDREDTKIILSSVAERVGSGTLVISTLASGYADEVWEIYRALFTSMGVKRVKHLCMDHRDESRKTLGLRFLSMRPRFSSPAAINSGSRPAWEARRSPNASRRFTGRAESSPEPRRARRRSAR